MTDMRKLRQLLPILSFLVPVILFFLDIFGIHFPISTGVVAVIGFSAVFILLALMTTSIGEHPPPPKIPLTLRCPRCGTELPADAEFCPQCGTKLPPHNQK